MLQALHRADGRIVAAAVERAEGFWARGRGLLGRAALPPGHALHIDPCRSIHTFGMRFCLDVVFLDDALVVVRVVRGVRPNRMVRGGWRSASVLELAAGSLSDVDLRPGDPLVFHDVPGTLSL